MIQNMKILSQVEVVTRTNYFHKLYQMTFLKSMKNTIIKIDFFRTSQYFRFKSQPQYKSFCGGMVSLLLIVGLIIMFSNKVYDTIQKVIITSDTSNINAADPTPFNISTYVQDKFMFGVQIWHHDLNSGKRFFDIVLKNVQYDTGEARDTSKIYPLEQCTLNHWEGFPQVQKDYQRLKMHYWLCPQKNMKYNIQGKYASVFSQTLEVEARKCTNSSNPQRPCATQSQIDNFFQQNGKFFFTIYFINPLINPTSEDYLSFYLQDSNYVIFTDTFGSEAIIFIEEYQITTDESIWPFSQYRDDKGGIVTGFSIKNPYEVQGDVYCNFAFFKSGNSHHIRRYFQRMDEVLSYIGGLFGTITICLFIIRIYNQAAFQIRLGASLFQIKNQSEEKILKNYNFFRFLATGFYKILCSIGFSPDWKSCKDYDESREQMTKQLDVLYLLKRLNFLEKAMTSLLDEHQIKGIHLHQKLTLKQAKINRKFFKAKKKLIQIDKQCKQKSPQNSNNSTLGSPQQFNPGFLGSNNPHKISNLNDLIAQRYNDQCIQSFARDRQIQLKTVFMKKKPSIKDDSESSLDSQVSDSDNILNEMNQLKKEANKGNPVSKKIWMKFDQQMRNDIAKILKTQKRFSESDKQDQDVAHQRESEMDLNAYIKASSSHQIKSKFSRKKIREQSKNYDGQLQVSNRGEKTEQLNEQLPEYLNQRKDFSPIDCRKEGKRTLKFLVENDNM